MDIHIFRQTLAGTYTRTSDLVRAADVKVMIQRWALAAWGGLDPPPKRKNPKPEICQKTWRVPTVRCTLYWAADFMKIQFFVLLLEFLE